MSKNNDYLKSIIENRLNQGISNSEAPNFDQKYPADTNPGTPIYNHMKNVLSKDKEDLFKDRYDKPIPLNGPVRCAEPHDMILKKQLDQTDITKKYFGIHRLDKIGGHSEIEPKIYFSIEKTSIN